MEYIQFEKYLKQADLILLEKEKLINNLFMEKHQSVLHNVPKI